MKIALLVKTSSGTKTTNNSGTTIVYVLQDICENCSHFGRLIVI